MDENKNDIKEEMKRNMEKMEQNIMEALIERLPKFIRFLKGTMKIKVVFRLNNFPIIRIFHGV